MNRDQLQKKIVDILMDIFPGSRIESPDQDLRKQVQLDSLTFVQFVTELEDEFSIEIDGDYLDINRFSTINKVIQLMEEIQGQ